MSLTQDDLQAIKGIVDDAIEESDRRTAAGFAEVHAQLADIRTDLTRVENKLDATVDRVDDHSAMLRSLIAKPA